MTFQQLNISQPVLKALEEKQFSTPTSIQQQAIPVALGGRDILGLAQTGTGKTAAFAIPVIEHLYRKSQAEKTRSIRALVLTPTRELAIQIEEAFAAYGKYTRLKCVVIYGGVRQNRQVEQLRRGADILIATPGRLLDLISQKIVDLGSVTHFVLDEADRMLDMGFVHDIKRLLPLLPQKRQNLLFSATMPKEIAVISETILHQPVKVEAAPVSSVVDTIEQRLYWVEKNEKIALLVDVLNTHIDKTILVFSRTKHGADKIARILNKRDIECMAIHGNKSQNARQLALSCFKSGKIRVIVATDIAARGIDVQNLGVVVNYDMPDVAETYVHRIGRTGRAGNRGIALSFCSKDEREVVRNIRKSLRQTLQPGESMCRISGLL